MRRLFMLSFFRLLLFFGGSFVIIRMQINRHEILVVLFFGRCILRRLHTRTLRCGPIPCG